MRRIDVHRLTAGLAAGLITAAGLAGCGSDPEVSYDAPARAGKDTLLVYVGPGAYRDVLEHAVDDLLPDTVKVQLADAPADANAQVAAGAADLAFYQDGPTFEGQQTSLPGLSVVSKVGVVPYALYSSRWTNLKATKSWVNVGVVEDHVEGQSLPHGAKVVLPGRTEDFARGLYLLQSAHLVKLDRPFGGTSSVDLTVTEANVKDSLRHLSLLGLHTLARVREVYQQFDAMVLLPHEASLLGLDPAKDALAVEPGPGNPYAQVLVAPSRLAGDPRVLALTHALESPELARFLRAEHPGTILPVAATRRG